MVAPKDKATSLTFARAQELFAYEPETGCMVWKVQKANNVKLGEAIGCKAGAYDAVWVDGVRFYLHRIAWLLMTGQWPVDLVDHIDGNKRNNRWANLRAATNADNQRNMALKSNNTSGRKGVYFERRRNKWRAQISENGRTRMIGRFADREEAYAAFCREASAVHGEFARL